MKPALVVILLFATINSYSQYYYNDIITTQQTNEQYLLLKKNHVQQVSAKSYEADGELTADFTLEQKIAANGSEITTTSEYSSTGKSVSQSFYSNDKINKTITNADNVTSTITYIYDSTNNLQSLISQTEDTFMNSSSRETHVWIYGSNLPVKMLLIKNSSDTTTVELIKDEHGDIAEERWRKNGRLLENYIYYYNDHHKLTDIVRFNAKAQRLLPDFLFEYDNNNVLMQLTQVPQGSDNYLIWHYQYAVNGLKEKELCFNKQKQPVGSIEYTYR
jgi:hypothetical protein